MASVTSPPGSAFQTPARLAAHKTPTWQRQSRLLAKKQSCSAPSSDTWVAASHSPHSKLLPCHSRRVEVGDVARNRGRPVHSSTSRPACRACWARCVELGPAAPPSCGCACGTRAGARSTARSATTSPAQLLQAGQPGTAGQERRCRPGLPAARQTTLPLPAVSESPWAAKPNEGWFSAPQNCTPNFGISPHEQQLCHQSCARKYVGCRATRQNLHSHFWQLTS